MREDEEYMVDWSEAGTSPGSAERFLSLSKRDKEDAILKRVT